MASAWAAMIASGRFVVAILAISALIALVALLPTLLLERMRDWTTFAATAGRLARGESLYFVDGQVMALYPPAMAFVWNLGMTSWIWRAIDMVSAVQVAWLAPTRARLGVAGLILIQAPLAYEILTGNMMAMFAGALAIRLATSGVRGAIPLGVIVAIAIKPFMIPVLLVLAVVRSRDVIPVIGISLVITVLGVLVAGIDAQVEYVRALLSFAGQTANWTNGNLGVSRLGPPWPTIAAIIAIAVTGFAVVRRRADVATGVAVCAGFLVQPSLGYYYAVVLPIPLLILLRYRRSDAVLAALASCILSILSPAIAAVVIAAPLVLRTPVPATYAPAAVLPGEAS